MNPYFKQYQQNQATTASPEKILIMLYDGAVRFVRQAAKGIETGDTAQKCEGISRAMAIIVEFSNSLDREVGGQIADDLDALYYFMTRQLMDVRKSDDVEKLNVVEGLLVDLRETWMQAIEIKRREEAEAQPEAVSSEHKTLVAAG